MFARCTFATVEPYLELILWLDSHRGSGQGFDLNSGIRVNWVNYVTHTHGLDMYISSIGDAILYYTHQLCQHVYYNQSELG